MSAENDKLSKTENIGGEKLKAVSAPAMEESDGRLQAKSQEEHKQEKRRQTLVKLGEKLSSLQSSMQSKSKKSQESSIEGEKSVFADINASPSD